MAFLGRKKTTVGLDIGSGLIKVAVIDHSKAEPELVKVAIAPLLADAIVEGEMMDPGIVAEAIQSALAQAGVKVKQVVTAVGGRDVIIKKIQIERVKEQQARELMRWEAEQHVPFDMESVELDFQILDPDGDGLEMSVLLVAAKRELVEAKLRVLTDAGIEPGIVDVDAFALHNAFEVNHPDAMTGVVALVNVGHEVTNINILDEGVPILTRDMTRGHAALPRRPAAGTRPGAEEAAGAHAGLRPLAASGRDDREPRRGDRGGYRACGGVPRVLVAHGERRCARCTLCGGGSRIPGLTQMLGHAAPALTWSRPTRWPTCRCVTARSSRSSQTKWLHC